MSASALIRSDYEDGELSRLCDESIEKARRRLDAVAGLPRERRTVENTLLEMESAMADFSDEVAPLTFMAYVATRESLTREGSACEEKVEQFGVQVATRKDLYDAVRDLTGRGPEESRLLSETLKDFELNGLNLPSAKLARVKELKSRLATLQTEFSKNLNTDNTVVEYLPEELAGATEAFLGRLKRTPDGKRYVVTTKSTDYFEVLENVRSPAARRRMLAAYLSRAGGPNTRLLEQAILLRQQVARAMGYKTWADYRMTDRMAKDSRTVLKFLNGLRASLAKRNRKDLQRLLQYKKKEDPKARAVDPWDILYLANQIRKTELSLDNEKIREYFPADQLVGRMLDTYSVLLGVRFVEIPAGEARAWHPDVKLYAIQDRASGRTVGRFFADFFPRENKYGHAAAFTLLSGRRMPDGGYRLPLSAIVANFTPPAQGKPSLLTHDEVETIFHEFGHILHQTLTRAPYASLSGSRTALDFVEAPSQLLENWVWNPKILDRLSGHYKTGDRLPKTIITQLLKAQDFNQGYFYTRQLYLALMDMAFHTAKGRVNTTRVADRLYQKIIGLKPLAGGRFQASFGHLMGGYDSGYYSYLWSEVYAQDLFTKFERGRTLDPKVGMKYRKIILEQGNMKEGMHLLQEFLGRKPSSRAFLKKLKIR